MYATKCICVSLELLHLKQNKCLNIEIDFQIDTEGFLVFVVRRNFSYCSLKQ